jgi:hypothetical protein
MNALVAVFDGGSSKRVRLNQNICCVRPLDQRPRWRGILDDYPKMPSPPASEMSAGRMPTRGVRIARRFGAS